MRMDEFMIALQSKLDTLQPNYPDNAEGILEVLFDVYNESSGFDNAAIGVNLERNRRVYLCRLPPYAGIMRMRDSLRVYR